MAKEERIRDAFSPLLDGELPAEEREAVEADLALDAELLRELDDLRRVDGLYKGLGATAAPEGFEERLRAAMAATAIETAEPRTIPFRRWIAPLLAAAACLVAVSAVVLQGLGGSPTGLEERSDMAAVSADEAANMRMLSAEPSADAVQAEAAPEPALAQAADEMARGREAEPAAETFFDVAEEGRDAPVAMAPPPAPMMAPPPPAAPAEPMRTQAGRDDESLAFGRAGASAPAAAPPASPPPAPPAREEAMTKAAEADGVTAEEAPAALAAGTYRFRFDDGRWVEEAYAGERAEPIGRSDPAWRGLPEEVRAVLEAQLRPVVLRIGGAWRVTAPAE